MNSPAYKFSNNFFLVLAVIGILIFFIAGIVMPPASIELLTILSLASVCLFIGLSGIQP